MTSDAIELFLRQAAEELRARATNEAPVDTGELRRDIGVFDERMPREIAVGHTPYVEYAKYVFYGTKAHTITPKRKKALKTKYGVFKKVRHPGTKPNKYLDRAYEGMVQSGALRQLLERFGEGVSQEVLDEILEGLKNLEIKG